ncbi:MAG: primosomal protein N' [Hyphomicrobiaceae bacterium]|nr:primosomal protein N' [Hyphomicrobiaceae bacterium]
MQTTVPVLLPLAIDMSYDYLLPEGLFVQPGDFVRVPLGSKERIGLVLDVAVGGSGKPVNPARLKAVIERLDVPPVPAVSRKFIDWVAQYSMAPRGMALRALMSAKAAFQPVKPKMGVRLGAQIPNKATESRQKVLQVVGDHVWSKVALAERAGVGASVVNGLMKSGVLVAELMTSETLPGPDPDYAVPTLSEQQEQAARSLRASVIAGKFEVLLLDGVTGAGKTEVIFEAIAQSLREGRQSLFMLPEIALTSQFLRRFESRFGVRPAPWHSEITPAERGRIWRGVASGELRAVIGARSSLFLPFKELGVIIVDEEHEPAYKQESQLIYHGRDMAVVRAMLGKIPVVLSSATPSIESHVNAINGRYTHLKLTERFAGAKLPDIEALDLRADPPERGRWIAPKLVGEMAQVLERGEQSLLFLNRRGYAPLTLCRTCGHRFECPDCSAWLVEHRFHNRLTCHHCGHSSPVPRRCPACSEEETLVACGPGVERVAEEVRERFPEARTAILSSDLITDVEEMRTLLEKISAREVDIIVGTQLVAKGHHFPGLALVGVVDGDLGLAHGDPRAGERTWQLLQQVTGRAGREQIAGRGLIQTYMPEHPVMQAMVSGDRERFLKEEGEARQKGALPPYGRLAALIISSNNSAEAAGYARILAQGAPRSAKLRVLGPAEAPIFMIRGRARFRLLIKAQREVDIQAFIKAWLAPLPKPKGQLKLTIDIDPHSFM